MAESLRLNSGLEFLNIESNCLSAENIHQMAVALAESGTGQNEKLGPSILKEWKFSNQRGVATFGAQVDKDLAKLCEKNFMIKKLGCSIHDPDSRNKVDRFVMRNSDWQRRAAKQNKTLDEARGDKRGSVIGYVPAISGKEVSYTMRELF